jgi:hypothetical protein
MPPMDDIMNEQIPEISEHQSHGRPARYLRPEQNEHWNEPTQPETKLRITLAQFWVSSAMSLSNSADVTAQVRELRLHRGVGK